jgi:hypothetical protein
MALCATLAATVIPKQAPAETLRLILATTDPGATESAELASAVEAHLSGLPITIQAARAQSLGEATATAEREGASMLVWLSADSSMATFVGMGETRASTEIANSDTGLGWTARCEVLASRVLALAVPLVRQAPAGDQPSTAGSPPEAASAVRRPPPSAPAPAPVEAEPPPEPSPAEAEPPGEPVLDPAPADWLIGIAPRIGVFVPIASRLDPFVLVGLDVELALRPLGKMLSVAVDATFTRPGHAGALQDQRFGEVTHVTRVYETKVALDLVLRLPGRHSRAAAVLGAGPIVQHLATRQTNSLTDRRAAEASLEVGGEALLGAQLRLGQGHAFLDARYTFTDLDHSLTGDTNAGGLGFALGYRLVF